MMMQMTSGHATDTKKPQRRGFVDWNNVPVGASENLTNVQRGLVLN